MLTSYLSIIDKVLVRDRAIIRGSHRYFKVYLPTEYNDIWELLHSEKRKIDIIVFLPEPINYVNKILVRNRRVTKEGERYKIYLSKKYNDIWGKLYREGKKVDTIIVLKQ